MFLKSAYICVERYVDPDGAIIFLEGDKIEDKTPLGLRKQNVFIFSVDDIKNRMLPLKYIKAMGIREKKMRGQVQSGFVYSFNESIISKHFTLVQEDKDKRRTR